MSEIKVSGLSFYPIKSCGGIEASEVTFTEQGVAHDREWMLIGKNNQFLSQRVHPKLALVQTRIEDGTLYAQAPGREELVVPLASDPEAQIILINLFKKPGSGADVGQDARDYFSDYLEKDARLIQLRQPRTIKPECQVDGAVTTTGFSDGFPILLASATSLRALNRHMQTEAKIGQFRANIILEGADEYDEDYWREVKIGKLRAYVVRACARCPVPNIDQQVGILTKERPVTEALRATRRGVDPVSTSGGEDEFFAQNLAHVFEPGVTVRVGDSVEVIERADDRNFRPTALVK